MWRWGDACQSPSGYMQGSQQKLAKSMWSLRKGWQLYRFSLRISQQSIMETRETSSPKYSIRGRGGRASQVKVKWIVFNAEEWGKTWRQQINTCKNNDTIIVPQIKKVTNRGSSILSKYWEIGSRWNQIERQYQIEEGVWGTQMPGDTLSLKSADIAEAGFGPCSGWLLVTCFQNTRGGWVCPVLPTHCVHIQRSLALWEKLL